ncbi:uncharacterized protein LOC132041538 [Lycium ferocissimum]|uniref:uncharacterized protein LOC132041538 n=1 Tax=Lycium ferocissimum TaxID=112874 RepID=UPI002815307A|nr:uncharacterized protein LOC132041538 [Lycium ferocissimum]
MMMKWLWRFNLEDAGLWKDVVIAKHGILDHWCTKASNLPYGVGLWKGIRRLWDTFVQQTHFEVGNGGSLLRFWKDKWVGSTSLQDDFPNLFRIAQDPNSVIAANREGNIWDLSFRRNMYDWEVNELLDLFSRLQQCHINPQAADKLKWGQHSGESTVKEGYHQMCSRNPFIDNWPWKLIWRTKLPLKVICFTWTALYEACLTQDNLMKRNTLPSRCHMAERRLKLPGIFSSTVKWPQKSAIWFFCLFGVNWTIPLSIKEAYESWNLWEVDKAIKKIWNMVPACIFWCIWLKRNRRCFQGCQHL